VLNNLSQQYSLRPWSVPALSAEFGQSRCAIFKQGDAMSRGVKPARVKQTISGNGMVV